jgi:hypothetical protein
MDRYCPPTNDHLAAEAIAHLDREEQELNRAADAALTAFCRQHGGKYHDCEILGELGVFDESDSWEVNLRLRGDLDLALAFIRAVSGAGRGRA